ncbi:monovalent cation/H+ antiporter complex subunit F [Flaviflexus huanghaiensis]|uniref:monovalent cation/H+ antiporter complex subunit F n=1 Tax=Flaviflexus huanghaiensis TaxID=1111473 RepID=UPI0015FB589D|nr:monovalent cation/H+ antiporter complex subunit F [Flaviflexus huanghaiensis]
MIVVAAISGALLFLSALAVIVRVSNGPSMLDRMVGVDLLTSIILCSVAVISAVSGRTDLLPVLVVLAVVGFIGSTTIARFIAHEPTADKRILTKDEVAKILEDERMRDDELVHDSTDDDAKEKHAG